MNFKVAIPSYKRSKILKLNTLKTLNEKGISSDRIDIFVANKSEYDEYKENIPSDLYNEIVIGKIGKNNQINFIRNYYDNKEKLLNLDDDVYRIDYLYNGKLEPLKNLDEYSKFIFKIMNKNKLGLAGTYYPHNPFFMKHKLDIGYYNIVGNLYWTINNKSSKLNLFLERGCEDLEFSLKNYEMYNGILRTREVVVFDKSVYTSEIESHYNDTVMKMTHLNLIKEYPHLIKKYVDGKGRVLVKNIPHNKKVINLKERRL